MRSNLPEYYAITPSPDGVVPERPILAQAACRDWLRCFERLLTSSIRLVQLRAKTLSSTQLRDLAWRCDSLASARGVVLLLNGPPDLVEQLGMPGIHLTSEALLAANERPLPSPHLIGASCHSARELTHAERIGADFACLSPVRPTRGYSEDSLLGLDGFAGMASKCSIPVYALGGMRRSDLEPVRRAGGHGVAGISGFWR